MNDVSHNAQLPIVNKYVQHQRSGIQSHNLTRHGIGYVVKGTKYIYYGDVRHEVTKGELFYLNIGNHYTEEIPENGKPFEQVVLYYTPEMLSDILSILQISFQLQIINDHTCHNCADKNHVVYPAWNTIKGFFTSLNHYIREDIFSKDPIIEKMKTTELIYLLIANPECCIKSKILENIDLSTENFERTIQKHIFDDLSIEELAKLCNKSLTSFKKEFNKQFHEPPHKWLIKQRLTHSRLLLISTNKSISEIGNKCTFTNTSHYIKLFKKEYGLTPAVYRAHSRSEKLSEIKEIMGAVRV